MLYVSYEQCMASWKAHAAAELTAPEEMPSVAAIRLHAPTAKSSTPEERPSTAPMSPAAVTVPRLSKECGQQPFQLMQHRAFDWWPNIPNQELSCQEVTLLYWRDRLNEASCGTPRALLQQGGNEWHSNSSLTRAEA